MPESTLATALRKFDATEANLVKLERLWSKAEKAIPQGIAFGGHAEYESACRAMDAIFGHLPKINGWKPSLALLSLNEIAQMRLDAREIDEIGAIVSTEEAVEAPGRCLSEYRFRFDQRRRELVRRRILEIEAAVDEVIGSCSLPLDGPDASGLLSKGLPWDELRSFISELETLFGASIARPARWTDLRRHLNFAELGDFYDIRAHDWPSVKSGLRSLLYGEDEAIPSDVDDLEEIVAARPSGTVPTRLNWASLTAEDFERLLFLLVSDEQGYENSEWLMQINAPDRGRDLSVYRVTNDALAGVTRHRLIIQCKHWLSKSVSVSDVAVAKEQMRLWTAPRVDVLVVASSGRFSTDAVQAIEIHNLSDSALRIEMWPESHLERLLAARPALIAEFGLR